MPKQLKVIFSGRVQGVGFRYQSRFFARQLHLTGYVKNLINGKVELTAQGNENGLKLLLGKIQEHFKGMIQDEEVIWEDSGETYQHFEIIF